jgi:hypothetical protein
MKSILALQENVWLVHKKNQRYGQHNLGKGNKILLEFVSANPTGPLHVGQGRWAAKYVTAAKQAGLLQYLSGKMLVPTLNLTRAETVFPPDEP